ncbi:MAG: diaminopimelate epimerase [Clostridia bacterium]|nr:diaminopimelate epimerase [Clostridia bacterium]
MHFTKMHGLGNDYLYHYGEIEKPADVSIKLSERHFGIGSDGIILITPSDCADFKMRIFNADGSEAKMCGNGIRCVGKYVFDKGYTDKTHLTVETLSGIKTLDLKTVGGKAAYATVDMGKCEVSKPVTLEALNRDVTLLPVSMGNPHAVIFVKDAENAPLTTLGAALEHHEFFPDGVNVEFVQVIDSLTLRMRVWERGSGITMACGTGSCASVAAAVAMGYCRENELVTVKLDGGDLNIKVLPDKTVMMTGPAKTVCECEVDM